MSSAASLSAELTAEFPAVLESTIYSLSDDDMACEIGREDDGSYRVSGERIERAAAMTYWDIDESSERFQRILAALGITEALEQAGIEVGNTVHVGEYELEWGE